MTEVTCFSEISLAFNGLHGVISQKIEFSITTTVRTSNPTNKLLHPGAQIVDYMLSYHMQSRYYARGRVLSHGSSVALLPFYFHAVQI
jgi:hypothetical protein